MLYQDFNSEFAVRERLTTSLLGLAGMVSILLSAPALAQGDGEQVLEEIVVTAQKREQSLQAVPIAISAISADTIDNARLEGIADYFRKTPNVLFYQEGNRARSEISIRGIRNLGGQFNANGVYVDEFLVTPGAVNATIDLQLKDVQRIEVLRGPQGTHFGRNATGGAINIVTQKPQPGTSGSIDLQYGRFDTLKGSGVLNVPLVDDLLMMRAVAFHEESDGWIDNIQPIGGSNDFEYQGGRVSARLTPTERLLIDLSFFYSGEDRGLDNYVPTGIFDISILEDLFGSGVDTGEGFYPENQSRVSHDAPYNTSNDTRIATARIQYDLPWAELVSITGYLGNDFLEFGEADNTALDGLIAKIGQEIESASQELRLQSRAVGPWNWQFGLYSAQEEITSDEFQRFGPDNGIDPGLDGFLVTEADELFEIESYAAFGEVTYAFSDRWTGILGARFTNDKIFADTDSRSFGFGEPLSQESDFTDFSPRVVLQYTIREGLMSYVSVAKGYKSGGLQLSEVLPQTDFDEETVWNYEWGAKGTFLDNRLRLNAAAFYMDWEDMQVSSVIRVENAFLGFTDNAAESSSKGVEIEMSALPTDGLVTNLSIGYLDAEFDEFSGCLIFGEPSDCTGKKIPRSAEWTLSADAQYTFPVTGGLDGFLRADWSFTSESFDQLDNNETTRVPSYSLWNLSAGLVADDYRLSVYAENAFDQDFITGYRSAAYFSGIHVFPSVRRYGLRLQVGFGERNSYR